MVTKYQLRQLGADREGWLDEPDLLVALHSQFLAFAKGRLVSVIDWNLPYDHNIAQFWIGHGIAEDHIGEELEHVSALEWVVFDDLTLIAIGTSQGYLLVYKTEGVLIHRQLIYPGRILRLRVRGTKRDIREDTSKSEDLCVVIQPGIIARFDGSAVQRVLQYQYQNGRRGYWRNSLTSKNRADEFLNAVIPYHLWNVSKYGEFVDAALTGVSPIVEAVSASRCYCVVAIGADASISAFRLSEDQSRKSFVEVIQSMIVSATVSTIASLSKLLWRTQQPTKKPEPKPEPNPPPFAQALPLACLKDHLNLGDKLAQSLGVAGETLVTFATIWTPLTGEKLTLSPSGTLAAITDSHGHIMLLDTRTVVIIRTWNGYPEASCYFVDILASDVSHAYVKDDFCFCLAIHAPRKGIVEIWEMRTGGRIQTVPCPKESKILQVAYKFGSAFSASSSTSYKPLQIFLLKGDSGRMSIFRSEQAEWAFN
ncbi:hypothetical protein M8C21_015014 [Ambrosia artemisiifolia]|uniref:Rab3-GAP regulatory subunit N-terminal domain-containing protein n=1 Tax=Ambrosia artemisiifolia TaxID=4212 RepID=A0AAD5CS04_AMBAR|nr:hypothetical protein M8C21_015014 [Ambrosia artemisiifolia]